MTMLNDTILHEIVTNGFNQLVVSPDLTVKRLVGYLDGEDDYYYILKNSYGSTTTYSYVSCVMALYFIKDMLEPSVYKSLSDSAELNGMTCEEAVITEKD